MRTIDPDNRPREKLAALGPSALSDLELLAAIIGHGTKKRGVQALAADVLTLIDQRNGDLCLQDISQLAGIGTAKASMLMAALEFCRRRIRPEGIVIRQASDLLPLVQYLADRKQEHFTCTSLNGGHEVIKTRIVTVGLVNTSQVHAREVFSDPITDRAAAIILAHNHPSGNLTPSQADIEITNKLIKAGSILGIQVLDHVIFSRRGHLSLREEKLVR